MRLEQNERSILATFPSSSKALKAKEHLKNIGIKEVQLDRTSRYGDKNDAEFNNPISGQADTGTGLTLYSADHDQFSNNDARVLKAADPSNYSMASKDYGVAGGSTFLLTVVSNEQKLPEIIKIIKENDGKV